MFSAGSANPGVKIAFDKDTNNDAIQVNFTAGTNSGAVTTSLYRDISAWYHILVAVDTTQATASNRVKIYVNSNQVTAFNASNYPALNTDYDVNNTVVHNIGRASQSSAEYLDGYLAEVNLIDGQALTPSSFGAFDTNGVWQPAKYTGSYGTNGFYLNFSDNSAATATTIGKDNSGNSNNWTPNNIVVTSGTTCDSMYDSPTNYADGGNGRGNYAVLNPLAKGANNTVANGNLTFSASGAASQTTFATIAATGGKWYWECTVTSTGGTYYPGFGIETNPSPNPTNQTGGTSTGYVYFINGQKFNNGALTAYGSTYTTNDIIGVAVDLDNGAIYFSKNNTWQNSGVPTSGSSKTGAAFTNIGSFMFPAFIGLAGSAEINFGQRPFTYTPPSGFSALNTQNLPTPTIAAGNKYFDATVYGGDGASPRSFTNSGTFQPDFVWVKNRTSGLYWNVLFDSVRGTGNQISSNQTDAELASASNVAGKVSAFNIDGFSVLAGSSSILSVNGTSNNYIAWQWNAGGSTVTNTSGSITSQVRANPTAGFSVVAFTSTSTTGTATIGHGLGVTPSMILMKDRSFTYNWDAWNSGLGAITNTLILNTTDSVFTTRQPFGSSTPTASVFTFNQGFYARTGDNIIAYCFAPVAGYSAFGSYTGNGSTDGPFVYTGFRPKFVLIKRSSAADDWKLIDAARDNYNAATQKLYPNLSAAENGSTGETASTNILDVLSNGFKCRTGNSGTNNSGDTYIFAAFAENPFKTSRAR